LLKDKCDLYCGRILHESAKVWSIGSTHGYNNSSMSTHDNSIFSG